MPRGDGTGPMGMGSMTGRAAGYCAGYSTPGYMNPGGGRGMGFGRGFARGGGRGFGRGAGAFGFNPAYNWGAPPVAPFVPNPGYVNPNVPVVDSGQELDALKNQATYFEESLADIKKRIAELETEASGKK